VLRFMGRTTGRAAGQTSSHKQGDTSRNTSSVIWPGTKQTITLEQSSATQHFWPTSRLRAISKCTDELARLRDAYGLPDVGDRYGVTLGEMDWAEELHRLLYED
jgi:hypothetical protein